MSVRKRGKYLHIFFRCYLPDGRKVRCDETTNLPDNKKNRQVVEKKDKIISDQLAYGNFKYLDFFPHGSKAKYFDKSYNDKLFSEWWDEWISEKSLKHNTEKNWNSAYRVHIEPYFSNCTLSEIDESRILNFRKSLQGKLKENSINDKVMKPLKMCFYAAFKRKLILEYPCKDIKPLKVNAEVTEPIDPFSLDELIKLLSALKEKNQKYYNLIYIWSRIGVRPGELCALKWKNVNWENKTLSVKGTMISKRKIGSPKTESSKRDIALRPSVIKVLKQQFKITKDSEFIFVTGSGEPFTTEYLRKKFKDTVCPSANLKYKPPVQMRHTFATLHIGAGENITYVSKMLGHTDVLSTLRFYNRYIPNLTGNDGSVFEKILREKEKSKKNFT